MTILTVPEWAKKYEVPKRTVYHWIKQGWLPTKAKKVTVRGIPEEITPETVKAK